VTGVSRARAKANGKSLGRPFKLTDHQRREARKRLQAGDTVREIARSYNASANVPCQVQ
jgi:DNA invertase Pin-like site-specific DNA recombinase